MSSKERKGYVFGMLASIVVAIVAALCVSSWAAATDYGKLKERVDGHGARVTALEGERPILVEIQKDMAKMNGKLDVLMLGVPDAWHLRAADRKAAAAVVDGGE